MRKINELVKRARSAKVHAYIISHLKTQMPAIFGKEKKQTELIENMDREFLVVQKMYNLAAGDFPDLEKFKDRAAVMNMADFQKLNAKMISSMDEVLSVDLPKLMALFPQVNTCPWF